MLDLAKYKHVGVEADIWVRFGLCVLEGFRSLTTECGWFEPLSVIKAYEHKKRKCGSKS